MGVATLPGTDRVDVDAMGRPFGGQRSREIDHRGLAGVVAGHRGKADLAGVGGDVDDGAAGPLRDELARRRLATSKQTANINGELKVELLPPLSQRLAHHDDAGIVDQGVYSAEGCYGLGQKTCDGGLRHWSHPRARLLCAPRGIEACASPPGLPH